MATTSKPITTNEAMAAGAMATVLVPLGFFALFIMLAGPKAWVLTLFWDWFVRPLFPAAPPLGWIEAFGLIWTAHLLRGGAGLEKPDKSRQKDICQVVGESLLFTGVTLLFGWALHLLAG